MGLITDQFNDTLADLKQASDVREARSTMQDATQTVADAWSYVDGLKTQGQFNIIPVELKQALNAWHQILQDFRFAIQNDSDVSELYLL